MELPDIFEVRQARALGDAVRAGDRERAEQLRRHLVVEGSEDAADAVELDELTAVLAAMVEQIAALERGDREEADRIAVRIVASYSPDVIRRTVALAVLQAAVKQGWLPAAAHDRLRRDLAAAGMLDDVAGLAAGLLAAVERRTE